MASTQRHYDSLAVPSKRERARGPAFALKKAHNELKRHLINEHASLCDFLVDIGCGRGGDIGKWMDAGIRRVLGIDTSEAQIGEALRRAAEIGAPAAYAFEVTDDALVDLDDIPDEVVDVVSMMFSLNYFFDDLEAITALVRAISRILKPGGKFIGVCADGASVRELLQRGPLETRAYTVTPVDGQHNAYRLRIADTVLDSQNKEAPVEYVVDFEALERLCANRGLRVCCEMRRPDVSSIHDKDFIRVSLLNRSFAFEKVHSGSATNSS